MKKVIIAILVVLVIVCTAVFVVLNNKSGNDIKQNENNVINMIDNTNIIDDTSDIATIQINGIKYKDINSIPDVEKNFDNNLVYAVPEKDNDGLYVKMSDSFILNDSTNHNVSNQRIILPSKIYSSDENSFYLYNYDNETYFIPVEKCLPEEEKIVYRDYGIEVIKANDSIAINGKITDDVIDGWDLREISNYNGELRYDDVSLCEAYMESWKISQETINEYSDVSLEDYISRRGLETNIYQVDFDDDSDTLEFIYACNILDHVHIDSSAETYFIMTYSKENGIKNYNDYDMQMLWFKNILNYKNVFYGFNAFEYGPKIDNLILVKENIITGYYIYDKDKGLIHVDRFANGEKYDEIGFNKLSKVAITLEGQHTIKKDENGKNFIDAFEMYDREYLYDENGDIVTNEDGSYKLNPNSKYIEDGTRIYINYINEDGYSFRFKTEDGIEYTINYYYT